MKPAGQRGRPAKFDQKRGVMEAGMAGSGGGAEAGGIPGDGLHPNHIMVGRGSQCDGRTAS